MQVSQTTVNICFVTVVKILKILSSIGYLFQLVTKYAGIAIISLDIVLFFSICKQRANEVASHLYPVCTRFARLQSRS
uniref:Uncharacterized protein n=1 Tax=Pararge aegeria TaxID=116150 RepID=S4PJC8_9NEOP